MAEEVGGITYTVDMDTAALTKGADRINAALEKVSRTTGKLDADAGTASTAVKRTGAALQDVTSSANTAGSAVNRFASTLNSVKGSSAKGVADTADSIKDAAKASDDANDPLNKLVDTMADGTSRANGFSFSMSALAQAISAIAFSGAVLGIASMVQKYQEMAERVQMATSSTEEFRLVQERLLNTANGTYRSLQEAQELYITTANSLRAMGYSTAQALDVTDSMSYAFVKNATSADKAKGAIDAFAKSINTGKVAADQWETLTSAIPTVIDAIAQSSGKTGAEIRKLGAEGKLTAAQLTEGLRKALDSTAEAAAKMSNNLIDAGVRSKTAITAFFVSVENQTGVLDKLTAAIIMAADDLLTFSSNSEGVAATITAASSAAAILATVIAGRLVGSVAGYASTQAVLLTNTIRQVAADQAAAQSGLLVARTNAAIATSALAAARAAEAAAVGFGHHATAVAALAVAEANALAATGALNAALATSASTATYASVAMRGLQTVMGFLGGPVGVILIAAAALYYFAKAARDTKVDVDQLNKSLDGMTFNQLAATANDLGDDVVKLNKQLSNSFSELRTMTARPWESQDEFLKRQTKVKAEIDATNKSLADRREALLKVEAAQRKQAQSQANGSKPENVTPKLPEDADAKKSIKDLQDQEELLKVIGVERAKLAAIQKLGDNASPAQREEAEKLATSIYNLQEAEKSRNAAAKKGNSEAESEQKKNLKTIQDLENALAALNVSARDASIQKAAENLGKLATPEQVARAKELAAAAFDATQAKAAATAISNLNEQILQAGTSARELAQRQAEVALGQYATPDQIAQVRQLAGALYDVQQRQTLLSSLKTDVPMVGEQANYDEQLARHKAYREAELITDQTYLDLRQQAEAAHEANLTKLQEERFRQQSKGNELLMASLDQVQTAGTNAFVGLVTGATTGQEAVQALASSIINEAVGAVVAYGVAQLKSFIIGQSAGAAAAGASIAEAGGVAAAWAPAAAASSVATLGGAAGVGLSALAGIVPAALSLFGGGRQYGGPVDTSKMYRVNEGGAPEIFNAAGGKQYMMPNTRGEVVSNKDASGAGGGGAGNAPIVNVNNYTGQQASATARYSEADKRFIIDVVAGDIGKGGKTGKVVNRTTGTRRAGS